MQISHLTLDTYDLAQDPESAVKLAAAGFDSSKLDKLPDRLFALVAENEGNTVRKYAMHNALHVQSSIDTFLEYGSALPEAARGIVAENLVMGCRWYDLEVPEKLASLANQPGFDLEKARAIGTKDPASGGQSIPGVGHEGTKQADLTGTDCMPVTSSKGLPKRKTPDVINPNTPKHAGDLSAYEAPAAAVPAYEPTHYALPQEKRYPLDVPDHVIKAAAYFDEWCLHFSPEQRREFAVNTAARADSFNLPVTGKVAAYAGEELGALFSEGIRQRMDRADEEGQQQYEMLKTAALEGVVAPGIAARVLGALDKEHGLVDAYDRPFVGIDDPYRACFGVKTAEAYVWSGGGVGIDEQGITMLIAEKYHAIARLFGDDVAKTLKEDPVPVFDSLPEPQKVALARLRDAADLDPSESRTS